MSNLALFNFEGANVRVVDISGEPWFVGKDVADILGYANTSKAIATHCKSVDTRPTEMGGQVRHVQVIPERDVYRLVMRSKQPAAERFEDWVVGTVLPSIRKTGSYNVMADPRFNIPQTYPDALRALASTVEENENLKSVNQELSRTKAHIGDKRQATAMAKASALSRKLKKVEALLGDSTDYKAVTAIDWLFDFFPKKGMNFSVLGRVLGNISREMDYQIKQCEHSKYDKVNTYHVGAIRELHRRLMADKGLLAKYRQGGK